MVEAGTFQLRFLKLCNIRHTTRDLKQSQGAISGVLGLDCLTARGGVSPALFGAMTLPKSLAIVRAVQLRGVQFQSTAVLHHCRA